MNKKKLKIARKKVDRLDNEIFNLIKKRTQIVKYMMRLKTYKTQIVDYKRINEILKKIKNKSRANKIDPKITPKTKLIPNWSQIDPKMIPNDTTARHGTHGTARAARHGTLFQNDTKLIPKLPPNPN